MAKPTAAIQKKLRTLSNCLTVTGIDLYATSIGNGKWDGTIDPRSSAAHTAKFLMDTNQRPTVWFSNDKAWRERHGADGKPGQFTILLSYDSPKGHAIDSTTLGRMVRDMAEALEIETFWDGSSLTCVQLKF